MAERPPVPENEPEPPGASLPPTRRDPPPVARPRRPIYRRRGALVAAAVLGTAALAAGVLYWLHSRQFEETDDAFIEGNIAPSSPRVAGTVQSVLVTDNQDVPAGMALVRLDPRDFQARGDQARATLEAARARWEAARTNVSLTRANTAAALTSARAGVEQADAAVRSSEAQLASAAADVKAAEAEAERRQADLRRYSSLDPRNVSQQQLDAARAAAEAAEAQLVAARKRAAAAESMVGEARARVGQARGSLEAASTAAEQVAAAEAQARSAQAVVDEARAAMELAELELSYTTVRAPVAGRITRKSVQPGQYVQAGQTLLAIVRPEVWVVANFKETQIARMHRGQDVEVRVDAYPDRRFRGHVDSIQAGTGARFSLLPPENATGNFVKVVQRVPVKIVLDRDPEADRLLGPGMSVAPRVRVGGGPSAPPEPISPPSDMRGEPTPASASEGGRGSDG
jgi:membrane fusion protein, multidrug efflux system